MKEYFENWNPRGEALKRVDQCESIIDEYQQQGLVLTLRQLYYQLVSRDLIPNNERSYKNLGTVVSKARLAGMLDWDAIEDRGRRPDLPTEFSGLRELVDAALKAYRRERWADQDNYAELWVEKAALAGVLEPVAKEFHVTLMVNKGYSSQSAMYESAKRIAEVCDRESGVETAHIFYLGDHDPSGQDMVRDIEERLHKFTREELPIVVTTLALTTAQVRRYSPPPNPTKVTDSRAQDYISRHGHECWEVDALDPSTLQQIIRTAFERIIDRDKMNEVIERERRDKAQLRLAVEKLTK